MKEKNLDEAMNHHSTVEKPFGNCRNGTPFISARAPVFLGIWVDAAELVTKGARKTPHEAEHYGKWMQDDAR